MNNDDSIWAALGIFAAAIALIFFGPLIGFFLSYVGGLICKVTFGSILCNALNTLFNVAYFTPDKLPMMAGALGWIGGFFSSGSAAANRFKSDDK